MDSVTDASRPTGTPDASIELDRESLSASLERKVDLVQESLSECDSALIAFSGGVDSSVVAALARDALGEDAVACTAKSETLPAAELDDSVRVAAEIGIPHEIVEFSELDDPAFVTNDDERCYHCRTMRLGRMYEKATEMGIHTVCDGTNASDPGEGHRPGLRAVEELSVRSPLLTHDIDKSEVRAIAEAYGLSVADKPSMACLSSRIPTGLEVTEERLTRVEKAERLLREWGFSQFRVRDHDGLARIEIATGELGGALDPEFAQAATEHLTDVGFEHVTLDLAGYRTGSVSPGDANESDETDEADETTERDGTGEESTTNDGTTNDLDLGRQYPRGN
ncbi:ATP-dependent sacrificial sulfur transferase LarE [Halopenitus sp. H-Gu1]|uniref:ATP-dependent sacrificial sulfur transferase LarE n=1 Tax=Halopenitus sp. H-Gu1 TaxID=3242697 RepID=UPI00359E8E69